MVFKEEQFFLFFFLQASNQAGTSWRSSACPRVSFETRGRGRASLPPRALLLALAVTVCATSTNKYGSSFHSVLLAGTMLCWLLLNRSTLRCA